ncbi:MAG: GreA/GreB family elongation factor [Minisyncoccota bacterium]
MDQTIYVSKEGLEALKAKLEKAQADLKTIRSEKAIAYTASGDTWHDNPHFNRLEQDERRKEAEVAELNGQIANARLYVVADKRNTTRVALGSIVHLRRYFKVSGQEDEQVWEVSGYGEIDVSKQRVAYNAPLMEAIIGLHIGENVETGSPQGRVEYEIVALFADWSEVPSNLKKF